MKIKIDNLIIDCDVAFSQHEKEKGLMGQENPKPMAFLYSSPGLNKFWMKNTPCKLLIIFCYQGKVISVDYGIPYSLKSVGPNKLSDLVIELPAYLYDGAVAVGATVSFL